MSGISLPRALAAGALALWLAAGPAAAAPDRFKVGASAYTIGSYDAAVRHWLDLAERGHGPAQYNVGHMHYYGKGVRRDVVEAYKWFLLASDNGIEQGTVALRLLGERMSSRQIAEATVRARDVRRKSAR